MILKDGFLNTIPWRKLLHLGGLIMYKMYREIGEFIPNELPSLSGTAAIDVIVHGSIGDIHNA